MDCITFLGRVLEREAPREDNERFGVMYGHGEMFVTAPGKDDALAVWLATIVKGSATIIVRGGTLEELEAASKAAVAERGLVGVVFRGGL